MLKCRGLKSLLTGEFVLACGPGGRVQNVREGMEQQEAGRPHLIQEAEKVNRNPQSPPQWCASSCKVYRLRFHTLSKQPSAWAPSVQTHVPVWDTTDPRAWCFCSLEGDLAESGELRNKGRTLCSYCLLVSSSWVSHDGQVVSWVVWSIIWVLMGLFSTEFLSFAIKLFIWKWDLAYELRLLELAL